MITLTKTSSEFGEITIAESRTKGSHIYWQGDWQQSEADRNGVSLATYVHAIFGLLGQTSAREMLMIGCGDGTLGTMLAHAGRSVTVVDINPQSIALARNIFLCLTTSPVTSRMARHSSNGATQSTTPSSSMRSSTRGFYPIFAPWNSFSWFENGWPPQDASS